MECSIPYKNRNRDVDWPGGAFGRRGTTQAQPRDDWRIRHPIPYNANLFNAAYGKGGYVMLGSGGVIATSSDRENWHTVHHPELVESVWQSDGALTVTNDNHIHTLMRDFGEPAHFFRLQGTP